MTKKEFAPVTPGEMLKEEFLAEYGLSQNQLAKAIGISPNRITEIINNRRRITADTALRLSLYFGNSPEFWLYLQSHYDLKMARSNLKQRYQTHKGTTSRLNLQTFSLCRYALFDDCSNELRSRRNRDNLLSRSLTSSVIWDAPPVWRALFGHSSSAGRRTS